MKNELILSSKGQITLPKEMRDILSLKSGDVISCSIVEGSLVLVPKSASFSDIAGILGTPPNGPASIDEINETVRKAGSENAVQGLDKDQADAA